MYHCDTKNLFVDYNFVIQTKLLQRNTKRHVIKYKSISVKLCSLKHFACPLKKNPHGKTASGEGGIEFTPLVCQGLVIVSLVTSFTCKMCISPFNPAKATPDLCRQEVCSVWSVCFFFCL